MVDSTTRCDLHVHSSASTGNDEWYTRLFACPESYAEPARQYELCKSRGMSLVTLTDHDTIAGGLQLIDRDDFFLSEEVTTRMPDSGLVLHVLAWNITPAHHEAIQTVRHDVIRLVDYLEEHEIAHALAHPLLSPSWSLDAPTVEKLLLLFPVLEGLNGLTDPRVQDALQAVLQTLDAGRIEELERRHRIRARGSQPHRKALTAGSDDHVHRRCGMVFTEVPSGGLDAPAFLRACVAGAARLHGEPADLNAMTLCVQHTAYHHVARNAPGHGCHPFVDLVESLAGRGRPDAAVDIQPGFVRSVELAMRRVGLSGDAPHDIVATPVKPTAAEDDQLMDGVRRLSDGLLDQGLGRLAGALPDLDFYGLLGGLRDLSGALMTLTPLLFAADHFGKQERQVANVLRAWHPAAAIGGHDRLAIMSDSLAEVDGVSTWCRRFLRRALAAGRDVVVPTCEALELSAEMTRAFHRVPAASTVRLPFYESYAWRIPSIAGLIDWAWRQRVSRFELATPGPMGLAGLLVAKVLHLPVTASYHTELPGMARAIAGSELPAGMLRKLLGWFYNAVDRVFVFSTASRTALLDMGVAPQRLQLVDMAVDPAEFSPEHRAPAVFETLDIRAGDRPVVLSVGRLSREKNLPVVIEAVRALQGRPSPPLLVIVGDGPERSVLQARYADCSFVHFAGVCRGELLRRLYASARLFVFASRVDTLGLVNLEAMASGLPVLIPYGAAMSDQVLHDSSAVCYELEPGALAASVAALLDDPQRAERIGSAGREAVVRRWDSSEWERFWNDEPVQRQ